MGCAQNKKTPLRLAIENKKEEAVAALRERGARDLHSAALLGDGEMVRACIEGGAAVDEPDGVRTPCPISTITLSPLYSPSSSSS